MIDGKALKEAREAKGLSQKALAQEVGVAQQLIGQLERGEVKTSKAIYKIAKSLDVGVTSLDPEIPSGAEGGDTVPLVGRAGAGSAVALFALNGDDPAEEVPLPPGVAASPTLVAVEIEGTSLGALFDRSLVFYDDRRSPVSEDLLRKLCIVGLTDGRVLIKQILPGSKRGFYHLLSQTEGMIEDVSIDWAARVKSVVPR